MTDGGDMVPAVKATVAPHENSGSHWSVNADGDLEVTVLTHSHAVPITALLGALVGGSGKGVWMVPPLGTEVLVAFPDGDYEGDAVIVGVMPTGSVPSGLTDGKVVIVGIEVLVHDGAGGAVPLALKSDVDSLRTVFNAHVHVVTGTASPSGDAVAGTAAVTVAPAGPPIGTSCLKGK